MKKEQRRQRTLKSEVRKQWEREQRLDRIINIAQELFFNRGYEGTTVDEIAAAAGYTKRSIYLYFRSRDEIFLAVVHRGLLIFKEALEKTAGEEPGPEVIRLARAFYRFSIDCPEHFALLMKYESRLHRYFNQNGSAVDENGYRMKCQRLSEESASHVISAIERDMKNGHIRTGLTARQLMLILWGQILGLMQVILMRRESFKEAYGIDPESLFNKSLRMAMKSLK